ncbi:MAG: carbohydrate-binding protein [Deinococcus-Thermus bacterium]|jgi:glucose/arabinose dehydrogenase|nr:carbohydrate-binding protein [Deinococcota bacterium]
MPDPVAFTVADVTADEEAGTVSLELSRTGDLEGPLEVFYNLRSATAVAGQDFVGTAGSVTIPDGAESGVIEIPIIDDELAEDAEPGLGGVQPERFGVSIETVEGGEVGIPRTANVFILDDESPAPSPPPSSTEPVYTASEEVVVPDVEAPIAIQWLPDDPAVMLIAEKGGAIRVYDTAAETFLPDLVDLSDEVNSANDRGLIDFILHPDFPETPKIYVTYTVDPPGVAGETGPAGADGIGNRFNWLVTYDVDLSGDSPAVIPESKEVLVGAAGQTLDDIAGEGALDYTSTEFVDVETFPASDIDSDTGEVRRDFWKMDSNSHVGGGLTFGPDGALYVAVGDGTSFNYDDERTRTVQDVDALAGKILRIDPLTGEGLPDNPFYTGDPDDNASKVWQLGLRNPLRIDFDDDGEFFISNTGWFSWEEINSGGAGANFGWPLFEGGDRGELLRAPAYAEQAWTAPLYAAFEAGELEITPPYRAFSHTEGVTDISVDGLVGASEIYEGDVYPEEVRGDFFFFDIVDPSAIYSVDTDDPDSVRTLFALPPGRGPVVMTEGPDGYMYFGDIRQNYVGRWLIDAEPAAFARFEAEAAAPAGTVTTLAANPGFSGTGYVDFGTSATDALEWTVDLDAAGTFELVVGYANGGLGEDRSLELEVDGEVIERLEFAPTGTWLGWDEQATSAPLTLATGTHAIRVNSDGGEGPNVDYLDIRPVPDGTGADPDAPVAPPALIFGLEAEDAVLGGTVTAAAENPGFSGEGYADFGLVARDFIEWTVEIPEDGFYDLAFTFANGAPTGDRSQTLVVDGTPVDILDFATTGAWTDWASETAGHPLRLAAGTHTVRLDSDGGEGPNVDFLDVLVAEPLTTPARYEAELAALRGTVTEVSATDIEVVPGYSGGGFVDFGTSPRDAVTWTVDVAEAGEYLLGFGYANGGLGEDRSLVLIVDGERVERLDFAPTGEWADWDEQAASAPIALDAGEHTIRLASDGGEGPNIDYLELTPPGAPPEPEPEPAPGDVVTDDGIADDDVVPGDGVPIVPIGDDDGVVAAPAAVGVRVDGVATTATASSDGGASAAVAYVVSAEEAGVYTLGIDPADDLVDDLELALYVDDRFVETIALAGGEAGGAPVTTDLPLDEGTQTVRLEATDAAAVDLGELAVAFGDTPI